MELTDSSKMKEDLHDCQQASQKFTTLIAGAAAGLVTDLVLYPLDTLKVRRQVGTNTGSLLRRGLNIATFYRGIESVVIGSAPSATLFFFTYETVKQRFQFTGSNGGIVAGNVLASCAGEIVSCAVRVPLDQVKIHAQAANQPLQHDDKLSMRSLLTHVRHLFSRRSLGYQLYRGWWITLWRDVPFSAVQFTLWDTGKRAWHKGKSGEQSSCHDGGAYGKMIRPLESGLIGCISGIIAALVTTPLDVVKTRYTLAQRTRENFPIRKYFGIIVEQDGVFGLFRGAVPRATWIGVGGFIFLGVYDAVRAIMV